MKKQKISISIIYLSSELMQNLHFPDSNESNWAWDFEEWKTLHLYWAKKGNSSDRLPFIWYLMELCKSKLKTVNWKIFDIEEETRRDEEEGERVVVENSRRLIEYLISYCLPADFHETIERAGKTMNLLTMPQKHFTTKQKINE